MRKKNHSFNKTFIQLYKNILYVHSSFLFSFLRLKGQFGDFDFAGIKF